MPEERLNYFHVISIKNSTGRSVVGLQLPFSCRLWARHPSQPLKDALRSPPCGCWLWEEPPYAAYKVGGCFFKASRRHLSLWIPFQSVHLSRSDSSTVISHLINSKSTDSKDPNYIHKIPSFSIYCNLNLRIKSCPINRPYPPSGGGVYMGHAQEELLEFWPPPSICPKASPNRPVLLSSSE